MKKINKVENTELENVLIKYIWNNIRVAIQEGYMHFTVINVANNAWGDMEQNEEVKKKTLNSVLSKMSEVGIRWFLEVDELAVSWTNNDQIEYMISEVWN